VARATHATRRFRRLVASIAAVSVAVGCGADESREKELTFDGTSAADRKSAQAIAEYFKANASRQPWFGKLRSVRVADGVVTFATTLDLEAQSRPGRDICVYLQGSDEADFTKGSAVLGAADSRYGCAARARPDKRLQSDGRRTAPFA